MTQTTNSKNSWSESDLDRLSKAITFAFKMQDTYTDSLDLKDRIAGWRFVLEHEFSVDEVLAALREFVAKKPKMPVPCEIKDIAKRRKKPRYEMVEVPEEVAERSMCYFINGKHYQKKMVAEGEEIAAPEVQQAIQGSVKEMAGE